MTRYALALLALLGSVLAASAQGLTTFAVIDGAGTPRTFRIVQNAANQYSYTQSICDPTTGATAAGNCATVTSGILQVGGTFQPGNTPNTTAWLFSPPGAAGTTTVQTIATGGTFQQALTASAGRKGCTIQYVGVAGVKGYVVFGANPGAGVLGTSYQLNNGDTLNCQSPSVIETRDAFVTGSAATDYFVVTVQ